MRSCPTRSTRRESCHGTEIVTTRYADGSIEVADHGRGIPIEWNENEQRYNWELVFCELYAGGKYKNDTGENYEFSLGLNGLGTCATQYSSEYMDVTVIRDGFEYGLHFEKGENKTGTKEGYTKKATNARKTGTTIRWKPDLEVFTDINIPVDYYLDTLKRQAVVNSHIKFVLKNQVGSRYETTEFLYQNGIVDYVTELAGENLLDLGAVSSTGRTNADATAPTRPEYKVKLSGARSASPQRCQARSSTTTTPVVAGAWRLHRSKAVRSGARVRQSTRISSRTIST